MSGYEDGGYIRSPISPIDQTTGTHAIIGVLAAILERHQTGKGGTVKTSLYETALALQRYNLQSFWLTGVQPPKVGSGHESLCPYQAFEAKDGPIMTGKVGSLWLTLAQFKKVWPAVLRGTGLGSILGLLPGGGAMLASFASYAVEKKISDDPSQFGKGAIQGVAGPESANNAGAQSSFIPLLTLGIPENAVMKRLLVIRGVQEKPCRTTTR